MNPFMGTMYETVMCIKNNDHMKSWIKNKECNFKFKTVAEYI